MLTRTQVARAVSLVGHPLVVMPLAVTWATAGRGLPGRVIAGAVGACAFVAVVVGVFSQLQVRRGRWRHIDASIPKERAELNRFLAVVLFGAAAGLWAAGQPRPVIAGMGIGGGLVGFAHGMRPWLKVSLHAAFAVYAAGLVWPSSAATTLLALLALGVGWSRAELQRHTRTEVLTGWVAGFVAVALLRLASA